MDLFAKLCVPVRLGCVLQFTMGMADPPTFWALYQHYTGYRIVFGNQGEIDLFQKSGLHLEAQTVVDLLTSNGDGITTITKLHALRGTRHIVLQGYLNVSATTLSLRGFTLLETLEVVCIEYRTLDRLQIPKGAPLRRVRLETTNTSCLCSLARDHHQTLEELYIVDNAVSNVQFLATMTNLKKLDVSGCEIETGTTFAHLTQLEALRCNDDSVFTADALEDMLTMSHMRQLSFVFCTSETLRRIIETPHLELGGDLFRSVRLANDIKLFGAMVEVRKADLLAAPEIHKDTLLFLGSRFNHLAFVKTLLLAGYKGDALASAFCLAYYMRNEDMCLLLLEPGIRFGDSAPMAFHSAVLSDSAAVFAAMLRHPEFDVPCYATVLAKRICTIPDAWCVEYVLDRLNDTQRFAAFKWCLHTQASGGLRHFLVRSDIDYVSDGGVALGQLVYSDAMLVEMILTYRRLVGENLEMMLVAALRHKQASALAILCESYTFETSEDSVHLALKARSAPMVLLMVERLDAGCNLDRIVHKGVLDYAHEPTVLDALISRTSPAVVADYRGFWRASSELLATYF